MPADRALRNALQIGRRQAHEVLKFRARALRKRAVALKAKPNACDHNGPLKLTKRCCGQSAKLRPPAYRSRKATLGLIIL
jgi:hypothetical protein